MAKTLCDWKKKDFEKKEDKLLKILQDPKFFCRRCGRVAASSKVLCKPKKLPALEAAKS